MDRNPEFEDIDHFMADFIDPLQDRYRDLSTCKLWQQENDHRHEQDWLRKQNIKKRPLPGQKSSTTDKHLKDLDANRLTALDILWTLSEE